MSIANKIVRRAQRTAISAWDKARPQFSVATRNGRITIPGTPGTGWVLSWHPDWKTQLIDRCLAANPGLLIDVGANIGQTLLDYCNASQKAGYVGFEPSPRCVEHLRGIIADSGLDDCRIVPAALAERNAALSFFARDAADPGATLVGDIDPSKPVIETIVPAYRFDDIIDDIIGTAPISLLKIDVEGAEAAVIAGMKRVMTQRRPMITCEVLNRAPSADRAQHRQRNVRLLELLREADYNLYAIEKSPDTTTLVGIKPIDDFPDVEFTRENVWMVDYLFVPSGRPIDFL